MTLWVSPGVTCDSVYSVDMDVLKMKDMQVYSGSPLVNSLDSGYSAVMKYGSSRSYKMLPSS